MRQRALIAYETHTCDLDERLNRLTAALHMTLPNLSFEDMHQMLYTEEEFSLLINIARTYHKLGQVRQSFYIYEQLYRVFKRNYYHHDLMIFFAQSYAIALSNEKADEDVIRVADDGIALAIEKNSMRFYQSCFMYRQNVFTCWGKQTNAGSIMHILLLCTDSSAIIGILKFYRPTPKSGFL